MLYPAELRRLINDLAELLNIKLNRWYSYGIQKWSIDDGHDGCHTVSLPYRVGRIKGHQTLMRAASNAQALQIRKVYQSR